jgi:hypothetical protein
MTIRRLTLCAALLVSACTVSPQQNVLEGEFHPPFTYIPWQTHDYTTPAGTKVCEVSSGYNGLTVVLSGAGVKEQVRVHGERFMHPGTSFTVIAGGDRVETYESQFSEQLSRRIFNDLSKGGKAYIEWSEFTGPPGVGRRHVQNIVKLDTFNGQISHCRVLLAPQATPAKRRYHG